MEKYDINSSFGKHKVKITLQDDEFKNDFIVKFGGIVKGKDVIDAAMDMLTEKIMDGDYGVIQLFDKDNNDLLISTEDFDEYDFQKLIIGVEIIEFEKES